VQDFGNAEVEVLGSEERRAESGAARGAASRARPAGASSRSRKAEVMPSDMVTACPYKGRATYLSFAVGENLAWTYPDPLPDASPLAGLVAFFDEVVDVTVDGVPRQRPDSPVAKLMKDEFGVS